MHDTYEQPERARRGSAATASSSSGTSSAIPSSAAAGSSVVQRRSITCSPQPSWPRACARLPSGVRRARAGVRARPAHDHRGVATARRDAVPAGRRSSGAASYLVHGDAGADRAEGARLSGGRRSRRRSRRARHSRSRPAFVRPEAVLVRRARERRDRRARAPCLRRLRLRRRVEHGALPRRARALAPARRRRGLGSVAVDRVRRRHAALPLRSRAAPVRPDDGHACRRAPVRQRLVRRLRARRPQLRARAAARHGVVLLPRPWQCRTGVRGTGPAGRCSRRSPSGRTCFAALVSSPRSRGCSSSATRYRAGKRSPPSRDSRRSSCP